MRQKNVTDIYILLIFAVTGNFSSRYYAVMTRIQHHYYKTNLLTPKNSKWTRPP